MIGERHDGADALTRVCGGPVGARRRDRGAVDGPERHAQRLLSLRAPHSDSVARLHLEAQAWTGRLAAPWWRRAIETDQLVSIAARGILRAAEKWTEAPVTLCKRAHPACCTGRTRNRLCSHGSGLDRLWRSCDGCFKIFRGGGAALAKKVG